MTAARGMITGEDGAALRPSVSIERLAIAAGLVALVVLAVALRLVPTILDPSINWGDEVFQVVEPAHRLVYGYGLMPWEFHVGMRSWLLPGFVAGLIEFARVFGDGPEYYLTAIAVGLGLLGAAPAVCCFMWGRLYFGLAAGFAAAAAVAVAPELVYFGARSLNEVVAAHLLIAALYLVAPGYPVEHRGRLIAAGMLLGLASLLRLQLAPAAALIALWPAAGLWRRRTACVIAGGLATSLVGAGFDWVTLGAPLASVWRNLYYNLVLGVSSGFSVEPWFYYLLGEVGVWLAAAPFVLLLIAVGARRMPLAFAAAAVLVVVHSAIAHKEYRFIYPAVLLAMVLAAVGLAQVTQWAAQWLWRRGLRQGVAAWAAAALITAVWAAGALGIWSHGALALLRHRAHDELLAMNFVRRLPTPCGVGLYGEEAWVRYGGYSRLHLPVPMYWPKDQAALTAQAAGFDTLLSDVPPPARLGFAPLRCFGEICVTRRPGSCEALPMPATWFPEQVRGTAAARSDLPALPAPLRGAVPAGR